MNNDLLTTARSLLALHDGACSVLRDSPIGQAFAEMERSGEVEIDASDTEGFVNVRMPLRVCLCGNAAGDKRMKHPDCSFHGNRRFKI